MNNYITLDTKRYFTVHRAWFPVTPKLVTVRVTQAGVTDATYGPVAPKEWRGTIRVPINATAPFGSKDDLLTSLSKREALSFTDHLGNTYSVHSVQEAVEDYVTPLWDGDTNHVKINVRLRS